MAVLNACPPRPAPLEQAELSGGVSVHIVAKEYYPDPWPRAAAWIKNATALYNKYAVETLGLPALTSQCS